MKSRTTKSFRELFRALPPDIQKQTRQAYKSFAVDPNYPGLNFKKVHARRNIYSARITRDYRAVAVREGDQLIWYWIGGHSEYEELLKHV